MVFQRVLFVLLLFTVGHSVGQTISTPKDTAFLAKDLSFGTLHDKLEVTNETTDTLLLNWKLTFSGKVPSGWSINFSDPENYYPVVVEGQDEDFQLKPDSTGNLIVGVTHNGQTGSGYLIFRVVNQNLVSDSLLFVYSVEVSQGPIGLEEYSTLVKVISEYQATVYFAEGAVFSLYSLDGKLLRTSSDKMRIASRESGIVVIQIDGQVIYQKLLTKH